MSDVGVGLYWAAPDTTAYSVEWLAKASWIYPPQLFSSILNKKPAAHSATHVRMHPRCRIIVDHQAFGFARLTALLTCPEASPSHFLATCSREANSLDVKATSCYIRSN